MGGLCSANSPEPRSVTFKATPTRISIPASQSPAHQHHHCSDSPARKSALDVCGTCFHLPCSCSKAPPATGPSTEEPPPALSPQTIEAYVRTARANPEQFWAYAHLGITHANTVVVIACGEHLTTEEKYALVGPLLSALVQTESRTVGKRGKSLLSQTLVHWMKTLLDQNEGSTAESSQIVSLLEGFLSHCSGPGEACSVLNAVQTLSAQRRIHDVNIEGLLQVYTKFRTLFSNYKQEGVCSFVPWIDAEKLLIAMTGLTQTQSSALLCPLKE